jgi:hypothetical protein
VTAKNLLIESQTTSESPRDGLIAAIGTKTAIVIGAVAPDGRPYAARGWGYVALDTDRPRIRVLVGAEDVPYLVGPNEAPYLAMTFTDVKTLASVQFKGPASTPEPASEDDLRAVEQYCDGFFDAVFEIDGIPREWMERLVPPSFAASEVDVEHVYNQTPGPNAGLAVDG